MSAFFVLSAVLAYHAGGGETTAASRVCWVSLSWVCSLLSVTCKESGLVAPALCLAWDFCRGTGVPPEPADSDSGEEEESECRPPSKVQQGVRWVRGFACERRNWATLAVGCALVAGRVWWMSGGYKLAAAYIHNPIATQPFLTRMLTFFHVQMMALRLLVAPVALAHEHTPFDLVESASDPRLWLGVFTLAAWLGVLWLLVSPTNTTHPEDSRTLTYRRQRVACAALMLVVPYLPASHVRHSRIACGDAHLTPVSARYSFTWRLCWPNAHCSCRLLGWPCCSQSCGRLHPPMIRRHLAGSAQVRQAARPQRRAATAAAAATVATVVTSMEHRTQRAENLGRCLR